MKPGWAPIRQLRYLRRYRFILRLLIKYDFVQILAQLKLYGLWERLYIKKTASEGLPHSNEIRFRMALEELGAAFIKIGQILSTRADLLPESYINELSRLQDHVAPFPSDKARRIVEEELKQPINNIFFSFDLEPLAAASIGQVHRAVLLNGEEVVLKIKRPGIDRLAFSIVLAALILGLSQGLWQNELPWLDRLGLPLAEITLIAAALAALWWLFAIIRSGRI